MVGGGISVGFVSMFVSSDLLFCTIECISNTLKRREKNGANKVVIPPPPLPFEQVPSCSIRIRFGKNESCSNTFENVLSKTELKGPLRQLPARKVVTSPF